MVWFFVFVFFFCTLSWLTILTDTFTWSLEHCSDMPLPASTLWNSQWHVVGSFQGSARHHFKAFTHLQGTRWHLRRLQAFLMPPLQLFPHLLSDFTSHQQGLLFKLAKFLQVKWKYLDLSMWSITLSVNLNSVANGGWDDPPSAWFL